MKKITTVAVAALVTLSFSVTAFAATQLRTHAGTQTGTKTQTRTQIKSGICVK